MRLKRLFYALHSALAARWIRERQTVPPMEFAPLRTLLPVTLETDVTALLAAKASADEKTTVLRPAELSGFLREELAAGQAARDTLPVLRGSSAAGELDALFRALLAEA